MIMQGRMFALISSGKSSFGSNSNQNDSEFCFLVEIE